MSRRSILGQHRDLRIAASARAVSSAGDAMALVALLLRVHDSAAGPWAVAALLGAAAAPTVFLAGWAGRLSDWADSRRVLLWSAAVQTAGCVALALTGRLWPTLVLVAVVQAGQAVANPTWQALVPLMVPEQETGRAVAATQSMSTLGMVAGPALAGVLVGLAGTRLPLLVDAATFLVIGLSALRLRTRRVPEPTRDGRPAKELGGLRLLRADDLLWPLVLMLVVFVLMAEGTNVVEVFLVRDSLGAGSAAYGLVGAVVAVGLLVGAQLGGRVEGSQRQATASVLAALTLSATLVLSGLAPALWVLLAVMLALGLANGALNTMVATLLLTRLPRERLGSGLAALNGLARSASVIALGLGGVAGAIFGPRVTFVGSGLVALAVTALAGLRVRSAGRIGPSVSTEGGGPADGASSDPAGQQRSEGLHASSPTG